MRRYRGFSIRLTLGTGWGSAQRSRSAGRYRLSGFDGLITLDAGATVVENLIVFGRVSGLAFNHTSSSDTEHAGTGFLGFVGAGARYHWMPFDWYASGALGMVGLLVTDDNGAKQKANPGFGFQVETGKQWFIGNKAQKRAVALGLRVDFATAGAAGPRDGTWISTAFTLVFATSYN